MWCQGAISAGLCVVFSSPSHILTLNVNLSSGALPNHHLSTSLYLSQQASHKPPNEHVDAISNLPLTGSELPLADGRRQS